MKIRQSSLAAIAVSLAALLALAPHAAAANKNKTATSTDKVDLNSASDKELEALPGVGVATAKKIVAGRPYSAIGDLAKAGVSASTIAKITPLVTVGPATAAATAAPATAAAAPAKAPAGAPASMVDLNTASQKDLEALPDVGPATAKKIIAGRPYAAIGDLSRAGVHASTIAKITPLVTVGPAAAAATTAPATAAPAANAAPAAAAAATAAPKVAAQAPAAQAPPQKGMVWVNLESKVFHREGDRWYGKTKRGQFMSEADAIAAGYREAKTGGSKK